MEELSKGLRAFQLLKQVMNEIRQNMEKQFQEMNITGPQGMLVGMLAHFGQMKISDLSEKLSLSNSTVSGIVDRLEKQGKVERIRSEEDRRVVYVNITEEFRSSTKEHFKNFQMKFEAMMNQATNEELDRILEGLETLKSVLNREEEQ
jgi:DNA-binding MarR family transcriptional regulator